MKGKRVNKTETNKEGIIIIILIIIVIICVVILMQNKKEKKDNNEQSQTSVVKNDTTIINKDNNISNENNVELTLIINNDNIWKGDHYDVGAILKLQNKSDSNKFEKALLVKCDHSFIETSEEPIDITIALAKGEYILDKEGTYKIQLFDKDNNQLKCKGTNLGFVIE